jgi:hypothetical protein
LYTVQILTDPAMPAVCPGIVERGGETGAFADPGDLAVVGGLLSTGALSACTGPVAAAEGDWEPQNTKGESARRAGAVRLERGSMATQSGIHGSGGLLAALETNTAAEPRGSSRA